MQIGFMGLLGLAFVVLKLLGAISWSWGWVLLPFYGGILLWFIVVALMIALGMKVTK